MGWLKRIFSGGEDEVQQDGVSTAKPKDVSDFKKLENGLEYCDLKVGGGAAPGSRGGRGQRGPGRGDRKHETERKRSAN